MKTNLIWFPINKKALPGVLIGMEDLINEPTALGSIIFNESDIALGIDADHHETLNSSSDRVIVIDEKKAPDLFSWLNTYTKESFPLSQFARVITQHDWDDLGLSKINHYQKNDFWASMILGEILGQGDAETDLSSLPLSRAGACYSYTLGRVAFAYGYKSVITQTAKLRLKFLEKDSRFLKRQLKIDVLEKVWDIGASSEDFNQNPAESVRFVKDILQDLASKHYDLLNLGLSPFDVLFNTNGLWSDSAETRVRAFDDLVDMCMHDKTLQTAGLEPVIIASAAFLVGRGTSHISLLNVISTTFPSCYIWFSLLAALSGPRFWHPDWAKAIRGIEKQLRQKVSITEPITADLCWTEYHWLSTTYQKTTIFQNIPKLFPRLLSIEVVPGATCQLRLETETTIKVGAKNSTHVSDTNKAKTNLMPILEKIEYLSQAAKMLHESSTTLTEDQVNELILSLFPKPSKIAKRKNTKS